MLQSRDKSEIGRWDSGLWAGTGRGVRGQCAQCVCGLSLRTGEDPGREVLQLQVMAAPLLILSALQEFLYKTAGGLSHWIGLTKAGSDGDWKWVDDTPFDKVLSKR